MTLLSKPSPFPPVEDPPEDQYLNSSSAEPMRPSRRRASSQPPRPPLNLLVPSRPNQSAPPTTYPHHLLVDPPPRYSLNPLPQLPINLYSNLPTPITISRSFAPTSITVNPLVIPSPSRSSREMHRLTYIPSPSPPLPPPPRHRILFYDKHRPHYGFTNFSPHDVTYKGKKYPTSEHLFQSFKFEDHRPGLAEHIRTCSDRPSVAFSEARRFKPEVRKDWLQINISKMDEVLWYKFTQHPRLKAELLATGDAELVEDSDKDSFWGVGADRRGRNELGKALERLRTKLRNPGR